MKRIVAVWLTLLVGLPSSVFAGEITTFESGKTSELVGLNSPEYLDSINISLPSGSIVMNATMDLSSVLSDANGTDYPSNVKIFLNNSLLWKFDRTGYGALGRQDVFLPEMKESKMEFSGNGGAYNSSIRLMKNADIYNSTVEINCSGPGWVDITKTLKAQKFNDYYGYSVANTGDVNGDGYEDIIIGEPANSTGGLRAGRAYIYFGGLNINGTADIVLNGGSAGDYFGASVSGAGDVNGDGFDDVIVGATHADRLNPYTDASKAYIFYGGNAMDNTPDVIFKGDVNTSFGISVSGAGDVNHDGYDDVIIGANNSSAYQIGVGNAYIYFGGSIMDNIPDVILFGTKDGDGFGHTVSDAGDVNGDGFDDVIVGAYFGEIVLENPYIFSAGAFIYFGGPLMDNQPDLNLMEGGPTDTFGGAVSGAGDVNGDGYDDVIVGAPGYDSYTGKAFIFYGGMNMNNVPDVILAGTGVGDLFGAKVSDAGDVNGDGYDDVIIGAPNNDSLDTNMGAVYLTYGGIYINIGKVLIFNGVHQNDGLYISVSGAGDVNGDGYSDVIVGTPVYGTSYILSHGGDGINQPELWIDNVRIWRKTSYINGTETTYPFASTLNKYLNSHSSTGTDEYGNSYVDVPIVTMTQSCGILVLSKLNIMYTYKTSVIQLKERLIEYIAAHGADKDANGNLTIPIKVTSTSPGRVKLFNLDIRLDGAPDLMSNIPDVRMAEDTIRTNLLDFRTYFRDDYDSVDNLGFNITVLTNESFVLINLNEGHNLSANAIINPLSENWTGQVKAVVRCTDTKNHSRESNEFNIIVYNVNDPPIIISTPPEDARAGEQYTYHVIAVDGDNDSINYSLLKKPLNMTINSTSGIIQWVPSAGGLDIIEVQVSDGRASTSQTFIITVPYRPPKITNTSIPEAYSSVQFLYDIPAISVDGRELNFLLLNANNGIKINASSGRLIWTPGNTGDYPCSVNISDGKTWIMYNFTIHVNKGLEFISEPIKDAFLGINYIYEVRVFGETGELLNFSLESAPTGMTINASNGEISWRPEILGTFNIKIKVSNEKGNVAIQEFILQVTQYFKAIVEIQKPKEGQTLHGKIIVMGNCTKGSLFVNYIQIRIDSYDWMNVTGNSTWEIMVDTSKLKDGKHKLEVRAYDGMDYSESVVRNISIGIVKKDRFIPGFAIVGAFLAIICGIFFSMRRLGYRTDRAKQLWCLSIGKPRNTFVTKKNRTR